MGKYNVKLIIHFFSKNHWAVKSTIYLYIILTWDFAEEISTLKRILAKEFGIKDLENLKYFLGLEVARS